jgi:hypothetical protein
MDVSGNSVVRMLLPLVFAAGCVRAGREASQPTQQHTPRIFELVSRADAAENAGRFQDAARLWLEAWTVNSGDPVTLFLAARNSARAGQPDTAFASLRRAIEMGFVIPDEALEREPALTALHADSRWSQLLGDARALAGQRDTTLRRELLTLAERDQANRARIDSLVRHFGRSSREADSLNAALVAEDAPLQARLREIVSARGWPGRRLVGDDGAHAAWLLLQHADSAYQRAMLPLVQDAVARGDARAADAALLEDRVRVSQGRPQRYGSALRYSTTPGAPPELEPIEDEACVDQRRASVQLPPLADYLGMFGVVYRPPGLACRGADRGR